MGGGGWRSGVRGWRGMRCDAVRGWGGGMRAVPRTRMRRQKSPSPDAAGLPLPGAQRSEVPGLKAEVPGVSPQFPRNSPCGSSPFVVFSPAFPPAAPGSVPPSLIPAGAAIGVKERRRSGREAAPGGGTESGSPSPSLRTPAPPPTPPDPPTARVWGLRTPPSLPPPPQIQPGSRSPVNEAEWRRKGARMGAGTGRGGGRNELKWGKMGLEVEKGGLERGEKGLGGAGSE